jgi:alkanesulfonate monooxygenase SsuD/methylene tetrahydromethanopterin reductase-like flavin-dependent oxidoreductase (luciferase family)
MRIGVNLGPTSNWPAILEAARRADKLGFDTVGFLDHYHSGNPEWGWLCGWSLYGALAMATTQIKLVPMVICRMNYLPGVLAKETAVLALISGGRFELGIGAGDYFEEMRAWGVPVPPAQERIDTLRETVQVLQRIWQGENVTLDGQYLQVRDGRCAPAPPVPPRVVVGVGSSRRLLHSALDYADEVNIYSDERLMREAHKLIIASAKPVTLSTFVWDWRDDLEDKLKEWEQLGVEHCIVTFWEPFDKLEQIAKLIS